MVHNQACAEGVAVGHHAPTLLPQVANLPLSMIKKKICIIVALINSHELILVKYILYNNSFDVPFSHFEQLLERSLFRTQVPSLNTTDR